MDEVYRSIPELLRTGHPVEIINRLRDTYDLDPRDAKRITEDMMRAVADAAGVLDYRDYLRKIRRGEA